MIHLLKKIITIIPEKFYKRRMRFFAWSILNTLLEFISIGALVPFILLLLNKNLINEIAFKYLKITLNNDVIVWAVLLLLLFYLVKNIIQIWIIKKQSSYIYAISTCISHQLAQRYLNDVQHYFGIDKGAFIRDLQRVPNIFATQLLTPLYILSTEFPILIAIVLAGLSLSFKLTLAACLCTTLTAWFILFIKQDRVKKINTAVASGYQSNANHLINLLHGFIDIKSAETEALFLKRFYKTNQNYNTQLAKLRVYKLTSIRYFEILIIVIIGALHLLSEVAENESIDLLFLSFFVSALLKLIPSFNKISNAFVDLKANRYAVDILHDKLYPRILEPLSKYAFKHKIVLQNVSFAYPNKPQLFSNINITITPATFTLITGNSGIGKTTLLKICSGMIVPSSGAVRIDDIKQHKPTFHPFVAYLRQQPFLCHGTLLENITMFKTHPINKKHIKELIAAMQLNSWYKTLPLGLETMLQADSQTLSGGQKQRISLIRALYTNPSLLLLDEATNQLNDSLKKDVMQYLKHLVTTKKLAVVIASHDESLKQYATRHVHLDLNKGENNV